MTHRLLPPDDWYRLEGTELESVWPLLPVDRSCVLVVEDGDQIVGCWAFTSVLHAEGVWVAPSHRARAGVARHLLSGMRAIARHMNAPTVWTGSASEQVDRICQGLGAQQVPFASWVIPMTKGES